METSQNGINLICGEEAFLSLPYNDADQNASIGFGTLLHKGPVTDADWKKYSHGITEAQAQALLKSDLVTVENVIKLHVKTELNQNQYDALSSFIYNVGAGEFEKSSVLTKLNLGDYEGASSSMLLYKFAGGKELQGLLNRREKEVELFNTVPA